MLLRLLLTLLISVNSEPVFSYWQRFVQAILMAGRRYKKLNLLSFQTQSIKFYSKTCYKNRLTSNLHSNYISLLGFFFKLFICPPNVKRSTFFSGFTIWPREISWSFYKKQNIRKPNLYSKTNISKIRKIRLRCLTNPSFQFNHHQWAHGRNFSREADLIAPKNLFHKSMLMIWSTINILPLFTYFIIYLRNKKCQFDFENSHISVQNN